MPLRPPACCRAVHPRVCSNPDAIWITDDILSNAYSKFCVKSSSQRRYGSHVPGPMEARRRTGRRRMAVMAEIVPPAPAFIPWKFDSQSVAKGLQNFLGFEDKRKTQWDLGWQPPRAPEPVTKEKIELPEWLSDYNPLPLPEEVSEPVVEIEVKPVEIPPVIETKGLPKQSTMKRELVKFRAQLETTDNVSELCDAFNSKVRQNLLLGLMSGDELNSFLGKVTKYLGHKFQSDETQASAYCLKFYKAAWDGISSCKVMGVQDFHPKVLTRFMSSLAELRIEHSPDIELVVTGVLRAVSENMLPHRIDGMTILVKNLAFNWTYSWIHGSQIAAMNNIAPQDNPLIDASVVELANLLNLLNQETVLDLVKDLTTRLGQDKSLDNVKKRVAFRHIWLNLISHVKGIDEPLFIRIWKIVDQLIKEGVEDIKVPHGVAKIENLRVSECCDIILSHWISCNLVKDPAAIRCTLDTLMLNRPQIQKLSCLVAVLDQQRELAWKKVKSLFQILGDVGHYTEILLALKYLPSLGIKLPVHVVAPQVKELTLVDFVVAFQIYKLYPRIRSDRECLTTKLDDPDSDFYIQMIRSKTRPSDIWTLLRIPLSYGNWQKPKKHKLPRLLLHPRRPKPLHPSRISLIRRMAVEFASAEHLTHRQAQRNVMQCILYLKKHYVTIKGRQDLSRALVHVVITRNLIDGIWVGTATLQWVLRWVALAEGAEVAQRLEEVIMAWRAPRIEARRWERRDANPLRVGPID